MTSTDDAVHAAAREHEGWLYVFAVNIQSGEVQATFAAPALAGATQAEALDEDRFVPIEGDAFQDAFGALEVHLYRAALAGDEDGAPGDEDGGTAVEEEPAPEGGDPATPDDGGAGTGDTGPGSVEGGCGCAFGEPASSFHGWLAAWGLLLAARRAQYGRRFQRPGRTPASR